jgi:2-hydroxy-3-keto-5-methylthiopentenyl-1-phosphate phosphatase
LLRQDEVKTDFTLGTLVMFLLMSTIPDLVTYCEREKVPFTTFDNFSEILDTVKAIAAGTLSVKDAATGRK